MLYSKHQPPFGGVRIPPFIMTEKIKEGDIRPVYKFAGLEVCKIASEKEEEQVWVQTEKESEAEMLSFIFKSSKKKKE